jgi:hypothetical protein
VLLLIANSTTAYYLRVATSDHNAAARNWKDFQSRAEARKEGPCRAERPSIRPDRRVRRPLVRGGRAKARRRHVHVPIPRASRTTQKHETPLRTLGQRSMRSEFGYGSRRRKSRSIPRASRTEERGTQPHGPDGPRTPFGRGSPVIRGRIFPRFLRLPKSHSFRRRERPPSRKTRTSVDPHD